MRKLQRRFGIREAGLVAGLLYLGFAAVGKAPTPSGVISLGCGALYMLFHYACHHGEGRLSLDQQLSLAIPTPPPAPPPEPQPVEPLPLPPTKPAPDTVVNADTTIIEALKDLRERIDLIMARHGGDAGGTS